MSGLTFKNNIIVQHIYTGGFLIKLLLEYIYSYYLTLLNICTNIKIKWGKKSLCIDMFYAYMQAYTHPNTHKCVKRVFIEFHKKL